MANLAGVPYRMREACRQCGCNDGYLERKGGQAVVRCRDCDRYCYSAPKHELGEAPEPVRSDGVSSSVRYLVAERAHFRCELCGRTENDGVTLEIGHLISEYDLRQARLALRFADAVENLAFLCRPCNLGMGRRSLPLHDLLVFLIRRQLDAERPA